MARVSLETVTGPILVTGGTGTLGGWLCSGGPSAPRLHLDRRVDRVPVGYYKAKLEAGVKYGRLVAACAEGVSENHG